MGSPNPPHEQSESADLEMADAEPYHEADDAADCGCGCCCGKAYCCRNFEQITVDQMLFQTTPGDLLLFKNGCSIGTCCIGCWTRSEIDHVGMIYHGASVVPANSAGKKGGIEVCYDTPHLVEAMSPICLAGPLKSVINGVLGGGGSIYWRRITRPVMEGEPEQKSSAGAPLPAFIPATSCHPEKEGRRRKPSEELALPRAHHGVMVQMPEDYDIQNFAKKTAVGGEQFYEVDNMTQKLEAASKDKDGKNIIPMKRKPVNIDVLDKAGRERLAAKLEDKIEDSSTGKKTYHYKEHLNYREWNQSCMDLAGTKYEGNFMQMVDATLMQDADCWEAVFGECCCGRNVSADGQSGSEAIEESKRKEEELFCSELVAQQMLRGGWRNGATESDQYLPKDFTDDPHELLSEDLTGGVSFGHMIQVVKEVTFTGKAPPAPKKAAPKKKKNSEDVARTDSDMKYGDAEAATAGEKQSLL